MSPRRTSPLEDLISIARRLPWWICIIMGIVSYIVLHIIATRPAVSVQNLNQLGDFMRHRLWAIMAMYGQYVLPFAFVIAALLSGIDSFRQKKIYENIEARSDVAALNEIPWEDFERLVGEYYRRQGFQVTREGGNGPDGGIDLLLRRNKEIYLVQCKQWKAFKVGVQPIREFYGVMAARGAAGGYFVTSGVYTEDAKAFAQRTSIELIDGHKLHKMINAARKQPLVEPIKKLSPTTNAPCCPKCGAEMQKRLARQGKHAGKEFWGCKSFPKCNGIIPLGKNTTS